MSELDRAGVQEALRDASPLEAQLLPLIIWPEAAPLPSVVDEWLRQREEREGPGGVSNSVTRRGERWVSSWSS